MNRQIIMGTLVAAMALTFKYPFNIIQAVLGLLLLALGIVKWKQKW